MDPYKILNISKGATPEEIRKAYRKAASKHHPDKGGELWVFQQVQQAYDALVNPKRSKQKAKRKKQPANKQTKPKSQGSPKQGSQSNSSQKRQREKARSKPQQEREWTPPKSKPGSDTKSEWKKSSRGNQSAPDSNPFAGFENPKRNQTSTNPGKNRGSQRRIRPLIPLLIILGSLAVTFLFSRDWRSAEDLRTEEIRKISRERLATTTATASRPNISRFPTPNPLPKTSTSVLIENASGYRSHPSVPIYKKRPGILFLRQFPDEATVTENNRIITPTRIGNSEDAYLLVSPAQQHIFAKVHYPHQGQFTHNLFTSVGVGKSAEVEFNSAGSKTLLTTKTNPRSSKRETQDQKEPMEPATFFLRNYPANTEILYNNVPVVPTKIGNTGDGYLLVSEGRYNLKTKRRSSSSSVKAGAIQEIKFSSNIERENNPSPRRIAYPRIGFLAHRTQRQFSNAGGNDWCEHARDEEPNRKPFAAMLTEKARTPEFIELEFVEKHCWYDRVRIHHDYLETRKRGEEEWLPDSDGEWISADD